MPKVEPKVEAPKVEASKEAPKTMPQAERRAPAS